MHNTSMHNTEEHRWQAVLERDPRHPDFVYAVLTTGIYCRSHCPSRRPCRENVQFFNTPGEAKAAGFRACKRCRPDSTRTLHDEIVSACEAIQTSQQSLSIGELASRAQLSPEHFQRQFKALTGTTPKGYERSCRLQRLQANLHDKRLSITQAVFDAGFTSMSQFYEQSTSLLGMTPSSLRSGANRLRILFSVGQCSLGSILVACTDQGVCCILLDDSAEMLVDELQRRFAKAELIGGDEQFDRIVAYVVGYVDQPNQDFELPLHIQGTAFQERVWTALRKIPAGTTVTYSDIAEKIGARKAHRAVASACAANHIAVAIPCHRVVRTDGHLSGYRWGIDRKRKLLEFEARRNPEA